MTQAMLIDPAMLFWLDGEKNTVNGANENLAREFMELFALGHGDGYTEDDVRNGARALTGWRIDPSGAAVLRPRLHDQTSKTVLGVTGNLDQVGFGDAVLARPASARSWPPGPTTSSCPTTILTPRPWPGWWPPTARAAT